MLEVCQFSRDASVAEAWLIAQEPNVASRDVGRSVNEVEKMLKRHEAFEKSTASWEERFSALERLTTVRPLPRKRAERTNAQTNKRKETGRVLGLRFFLGLGRGSRVGVTQPLAFGPKHRQNLRLVFADAFTRLALRVVVMQIVL